MIRIDEIYYNVFVKALQQHRGVGLHWFDPFGSTAFENICSVPAVDGAAQRRLVFYDQEPLHRDRVQNFLAPFCQTYQGPTTLITSERDSEDVEWACNTYGLTSEYYFFHGWAALDWFRGYNRSFLIKPGQDRTPTTTFLAPNRIIAGQRQHRLEMLYWIFKLGLTDNHISCPVVCPAEQVSIYDAVRSLPYTDAVAVFESAGLPRQFAGETDHPMHSCWLSLFDEAADSLLYLVTETVAQGRKHHLTEKTFKPIALGMPFVLVGTAGSLEYLRSYGFKTFGHLWDETYDDISCDQDRIRAIGTLLESLCGLEPRQRLALHQQAQEVVEHNYNHFYNGGFEKILWAELTGMLDRVKSSL